MIKYIKIILTLLIFQVSLGASASEVLVEEISRSHSTFLDKEIEVIGYLSDIPSLYLHNGRNKVAVYTEKDMMTLFEDGYFDKETCVKVKGMYKFSSIHNQYYIEESEIKVDSKCNQFFKN